MDNPLILPAFYLPPIAYFSAILNSTQPILLEKCEHYPKQTYRNRTSIYSANGKLDLIVPVQRGSNGHTRMGDLKISYEADWQRLHWMSLQTAYRSSAYFEYYEAYFAPFYHQRYERLFDYNAAQLTLLFTLLRINREVGYTESYRDDYATAVDFRQSIHPKKTPPDHTGKPYYQVFESRHGFIENLSIIDLLFNQGPQSIDYLID